MSRPKSTGARLLSRLFNAVALRNTNNRLGHVVDPRSASPPRAHIKAWADGLTFMITRPYRSTLEKGLIDFGGVNDDVRSP
jgi:hypothetical protein